MSNAKTERRKWVELETALANLGSRATRLAGMIRVGEGLDGIHRGSVRLVVQRALDELTYCVDAISNARGY